VSAMVSVVMPARNSERYIGQAIDSVVQQTHGDWELIVVDDGSADGTWSILEKLAARDRRIRPLKVGLTVGPARARNLAIQCAAGRFIAFLDSDDLWHFAKLERQLDVMQRTGAVLSFTAYKKIDPQGNVGHAVIEAPPTVTYADLLKTNLIGCLTALYDAHALGKMYMPEQRHEDYALWLAILRRTVGATGTPVAGINEPLAYYRVHAGSVSHNKLKAARMQWAVYRQVEGLSLRRSLYYFLHYAWHGLRKTLL
jgi:glycosyltransferase involved in cell wall biosynthesis